MANLANSYDQNAEPASDFDPVPAGKYRAKIIESEIEDISKNHDYGRCLKLTWQVETGPYDGRLIWQRLNMWAHGMNNNDKVVTIAHQQFASIRQATGKMTPQDSQELHHIPCMIGVKIRKQEGYNPSNDVTSVNAVDGSGSAASGQQSFSPPAQQGGGGQSAPWRKPAA